MHFPVFAHSMFAPVFNRPQGLLVRTVVDDIEWSKPAFVPYQPFYLNDKGEDCAVNLDN